jgi:uncharacterized protein DUF3987
MADEKYERKCENWLATFGKWILPVAEAPERFVMWTGLFVLASALRRKVTIPKSILSQWSADPNIYIFFIGDAGRVRKTTTMGPAQELLELLGDITFAPDIITKEDLLKKMAKDSPDATMCIFSPEFSEFIAKSGPSMYSFLTNMYDGKKRLASTTISRSADYVEKPCINLLAATTPIWVSENMSEAVIGGGFASRVIFVYEDTVSKRRLIWRKKLEELKEIREAQFNALLEDLQHINNTISGDFSFDSEETEDWANEWYEKNADLGRNKPKLSGYYERRPAHVLKVAMLCHIAYSDTLVISKPDLEMAIDIVSGIEPNLNNVFKTVGKNPYTADVESIIEYVMNNEKVSKSDVLREFRTSATPQMLEELMTGLIEAGILEVKYYDKLVDVEKNKIERVYYLEVSLSFIGASENGSAPVD